LIGLIGSDLLTHWQTRVTGLLRNSALDDLKAVRTDIHQALRYEHAKKHAWRYRCTATLPCWTANPMRIFAGRLTKHRSARPARSCRDDDVNERGYNACAAMSSMRIPVTVSFARTDRAAAQKVSL
jgi:hypothetical protein